MRKPMPLLLACLLLTACASNPPTSSVRSTAPTIQCGEHEHAEHLPAYPVGPAVESLETVAAYSLEQAKWAIQAVGIAKRNAIKANATADCLDAYRGRGIIK